MAAQAYQNQENWSEDEEVMSKFTLTILALSRISNNSMFKVLWRPPSPGHSDL